MVDTEHKSTLIKAIDYEPYTETLTVYFKHYYTEKLIHQNVTSDYYTELITAKSIGKFYIQYIKPNFKIKFMSTETKNKPKGVNKHSDKKRFIKMRLKVGEIKKEWMFVGEKGVYLDITLMMLPDGDVDQYENLGMVVQDVPESVYKTDKKIKGAILGNAKELEWAGAEGAVGGGGALVGDNSKIQDDLPF